MNLFNLSTSWASACPGNQRGKRFIAATDHCFNTAIASIAYPTGEAKVLCLLHHIPAIANALHKAGNIESLCDARHKHSQRRILSEVGDGTGGAELRWPIVLCRRKRRVICSARA